MRRRRLIIIAFTVALLAAGVAVAALLYDGARSERLAPGVRVGGVPVGGLKVAAAREKLLATAVRPLRRTLSVRAAGQTYTLSAGHARVRVDIDAALAEALDVSRRGWIGARVVRALTGGRVDADVSLHTHLDRAVVRRFARRIDHDVTVEARSAGVTPHADALEVTGAREGRSMDSKALARTLTASLKDPRRPERIDAPVRTVAPEVTDATLVKKYPSYILIDRHEHKLRLYLDLKLERTYDIAVGRQGLETPAGLYEVQWREKNPIWRVPKSDWAGALAGKNIPPGPDNPIKARWMAFDGAAGIHGIDPSEYGSIGHDASHGCVRMRIPDVIDLYDKTAVGTPVNIA